MHSVSTLSRQTLRQLIARTAVNVRILHLTNTRRRLCRALMALQYNVYIHMCTGLEATTLKFQMYVQETKLPPIGQHLVTNWSESGHQVISKWLASGHQVVTIWEPYQTIW